MVVLCLIVLILVGQMAAIDASRCIITTPPKTRRRRRVGCLTAPKILQIPHLMRLLGTTASPTGSSKKPENNTHARQETYHETSLRLAKSPKKIYSTMSMASCTRQNTAKPLPTTSKSRCRAFRWSKKPKISGHSVARGANWARCM